MLAVGSYMAPRLVSTIPGPQFGLLYSPPTTTSLPSPSTAEEKSEGPYPGGIDAAWDHVPFAKFPKLSGANLYQLLEQFCCTMIVPSVIRSAAPGAVNNAGGFNDVQACATWLGVNVVVKSLAMSLAVLVSPPPETEAVFVTPPEAPTGTITATAITG